MKPEPEVSTVPAPETEVPPYDFAPLGLELFVANLADPMKWNWTRQGWSERDAADKALRLLARHGLIQHREHPLGGNIWQINGRIYGRTDGVTPSVGAGVSSPAAGVAEKKDLSGMESSDTSDSLSRGKNIGGITDGPAQNHLRVPTATNAETIHTLSVIRAANGDLWAEEGTQWRHDLHQKIEALCLTRITELRAPSVADAEQDRLSGLKEPDVNAGNEPMTELP